MVLRDLTKIFLKANATLQSQKYQNSIKCQLDKSSKIIFDDGAMATGITALALAFECESLRVKDEVIINNQNYQITKIQLEHQHLKRLFLKEL